MQACGSLGALAVRLEVLVPSVEKAALYGFSGGTLAHSLAHQTPIRPEAPLGPAYADHLICRHFHYAPGWIRTTDLSLRRPLGQ